MSNINALKAEHKVDHLILLVGGNPLPNAVVGSLLTNSGGKITLIHSEGEHGTRKVAERIAASFGSTFSFTEDNFVAVQEASRISIETAMYKIVEAATGVIGLNYTGGTKAMSTHAFRALEKFVEEHKRKAVFSYLDARKLTLQIDVYEQDTQGNWKLPDHSDEVSIGGVSFPLAKMLALHQWRETAGNPSIKKPLLPETALKIAALTQGEHKNSWMKWRNGELAIKKNSHSGLADAVLTLPKHDRNMGDFIQALQTEAGFTGYHLPIEATALKLGVKATQLFEFFDAKWLEALAMQAFIDCRASYGLSDVCASLKPFHTVNRDINFELDCVALRGYQLFAVSCTVDDGKPISKHHMIEAYVRARQIGGDEARVALISMYPRPDILLAEVQRDLEAGNKVQVFGPDDVPNLPAKFKEWIKECI